MTDTTTTITGLERLLNLARAERDRLDAALQQAQERALRAEAALKPSDDMREALAAYAHGAWSGWQAYEFSKGTFNPDGTWTMPAWAVERWTRQMRTAYSDLSEKEKQSDRAEADQILAIITSTKEQP